MSLKIGDKLPEFKAQDQSGEVFDSKKELAGKAAVIYFYPKDNTPGCTREACTFRDSYEEFVDAGIEVIGVSTDSVDSHKNFSEKHNLPFKLLSDHDKNLEKIFGVKRNLFGLIPGRVTYIFDDRGTLVKRFESHVNINGHVKEALDTLKVA